MGKIGLVLEGGAMRGMYTAGVLDAFLEKDIPFDGIIGVSAGALFGVNYLSRQRGRVIRYNKRFNRDKNYMGLRPLLREGNLVSTPYAYGEVPRKLDAFDDAAFMASGVPFYAVVTDVATGQPAYLPVTSVFAQMDTLRASGSMPFVSRPVTIGEHQYLDGGISNSIPFVWMARQGYDKLVVVLTRDAGYRKKPLPKALVSLGLHGKPRLAAALANRHAVYNRAVEELAQWEQQGWAFVVRPSRPLTIHRMERDPDKLQAVYALGLADARAALPRLGDYLGSV